MCVFDITPESDFEIVKEKALSETKQFLLSKGRALYSEEFTHEWVSIRKYKQTTQSWGPFSDPALWAKWGDRGYNGIGVRMKYAVTDNSSEAPVYEQNNINPGSDWYSVIPNHNEHQAVWRIEAYVTYDNKLATILDDEGNEIYGWSKPIIISGVAGRDGMPINYKTYVYKLSDSKPNKPLNDDPQNPGGGWQDYPDSVGQWWQCVGSVNGLTGMVTEWSEVLIVNGRDGVAQDGKFTEMRFSVNSSNTKAPSLNKTDRNPSGWYVTPPSKATSQFMWMTLAQVNPGGDTLASEWATPICITGERGPQGYTGATGATGPMGPYGLTGIPGVEIKAVYSLGTAESVDANFDSVISKQESITGYGWLETVPKTTSQKPYIWCTQARFKYVRNTATSNNFTKKLDGVWCEPFLMTGTKGEAGGSSPIIYPAGIYSNTTRYVATESKAPYVWDANYQEFYILNFVDKDGWLGTEQNNYTPGESFDHNGNKYWDKLESFDAIYANVGIFGNALVGSAVFNGNYMFSQHGEGNYENFDGKTNDPYAEDSRFKPAWCVNLVTGETWMGTGTNNFNPDGSATLAGGRMSWSTNGDITFGKDSNWDDEATIGSLGITMTGTIANTGHSLRMNSNQINITGKSGTRESTIFISDESILIVDNAGRQVSVSPHHVIVQKGNKYSQIMETQIAVTDTDTYEALYITKNNIFKKDSFGSYKYVQWA